MFQKIIIVGNLGRDPEMRYMPDGTAVTNMSVAVKAGFGDKAYTMWYRVAVWGKQAESCHEYLAKGRKVLVEGEMQGDPQTGSPKMFTRQDGTSSSSFEIRARDVRFLSGRDEGEAQQVASGGASYEEDDIPF
jgi:single-strand DNA-binding protein